MSNPPGMLVAAIGTVDGIEFTLSNETDQDITVSLFVTPVTSEWVNVFAPQLTVAPISFFDRWSDSPYSLQYLYEAPPGVYSAFVQPITRPPYRVGTNLVVTAEMDPDYLNQENVELMDSVPVGLPAGSL